MRHALTLPLAAIATLFALQAHAADQARSVAPFTFGKKTRCTQPARSPTLRRRSPRAGGWTAGSRW